MRRSRAHLAAALSDVRVIAAGIEDRLPRIGACKDCVNGLLKAEWRRQDDKPHMICSILRLRRPFPCHSSLASCLLQCAATNPASAGADVLIITLPLTASILIIKSLLCILGERWAAAPGETGLPGCSLV